MIPPRPSAVRPSNAFPQWFVPAIFALLLCVALWVMTRQWHASLLDRFQFRQTQTALTTDWMMKDGFHWAYLMPVFGPPWSAPMEFPLYQWLVAKFAGATGVSLVSAARTVGILCFLAALPAVYGLAKLIEPDPRRRLLIPAAILTAPVCLFYSRAFMIESCAAALSVWFLYAYVRSLELTGWRWTAITLATGVLAGIVKVTTFALFGVPAIVYTLYVVRQKMRTVPASEKRATLVRLATVALVPAIPILVATYAWVAFSDVIKRSNPIASMLTSKSLSAWNFGTLAQRFEPTVWKFVGHEWSIGSVSIWATLLLAVALPVIAASYRKAALLCAAGFLSGPLIFTNLFAIHEYYYYPAAFFAAAAAGIVLAGLLATPRLPVGAKIAWTLLFIGLQAVNFNSDYARTLKYPPAAPPPMIDLVKRVTPPENVVLIYGWDWNTLIPYYADRRAILMTPSREKDPAVLQEVVARLKPGQVSTLVLQGDRKQDTAFIKWCTGLLNLSSTPVAKSPDGDIYCSPDQAQALKSELGENINRYPGIEFNFNNPFARPDPRLIYQKPVPADYAAVASPAPFAVFNPWTIQVADIAGAPGISANAPSELHFHAPVGAKRIEASVGILDGAFTGPGKTDGIDVVIFELLPSGGRHVLYQRYLNPAVNPADRGLQSIRLDAIGPISGPIIFGLYPGPADNMSFDWGYWRKIKIE
ncbi:MAG: hypothetical protein ABI273_19360 [Lacunisphaera sp.]